MGLITKTVKVKWIGRNKKHYVDLGYVYTKMGDEFEVKVEHLPKGSNIKVKALCDNCGKEINYTYQNYNKYVKENGKTYCNKCVMKLYGSENVRKGHLKKSKTFEQWCIENNRQDVLNRWDFELNNCKPSEINYSTAKKYWFKCDKHTKHKSELKNIKDFTSGHNGVMDCKQCNSIAQWFLDNNFKLENYWDYDKNILNPWEISHCSNNKKIWIKCQEKDYHKSYEVKCSNFVNGNRCPYCSGKKVHPKDSLGQYIIDNYGEDFLWKVWSDKNKKSLFEYSPNSNKNIWWKCLDGKHDDYERKCSDSIKCNFRCPTCTQEKVESVIEEKTRLYLESLGYTILHEHNCTIRPFNSKTKKPLPYDNEVILDNEKHLIIEVHGEQHYKLKKWWIDENITPEQQLHYQQVKDRYKRIYAIQHGYHYLEIPYTAFDKQETYKKLIDDKIKQIKNQEESA